MPPEETFLTVKEFAELTGRSRKRIYELMKGKLSSYCRSDGSRTVISAAALSLFADSVKVTEQNCQGDKKICKGDSSETVKVTKPETAADTQLSENDSVKVTSGNCHGDNPETVKVTEKNCQGDKPETEPRSEHIADLQSEIAMLRDQLAAKDSQLAALTAALQFAQQQAAELTTALTQAQALNAGNMQMLMDRAAPEPATASQKADVPESIPTPQPKQEPHRAQQRKRESPPERPVMKTPPPQRKPGVLARLFGKRE